MVTPEARFEFGENWSRFLRLVDGNRIAAAQQSLQDMLGVELLDGVRFLDIGSGSGLFSLAARGLGASVHSFDYDSQSVACTSALRARYFPNDPDWIVEQGSALDRAYLERLGTFDVVYSWGVLHHTGRMWNAVDNAARAVAPRGKLFIALYNDQGAKSKFWWWVKRIFVSLPRPLRVPWIVLVMAPFELRLIARSISKGRPLEYVNQWTNYRSTRGMSRWRDMVDWVGGFPFEVASAAAVRQYLGERGFKEVRSKPTADAGCSEYLFERIERTPGPDRDG